MTRGLAVLGATGSIGTQTMALLQGPLRDLFTVVGLAAMGSDGEALLRLGRESGAGRLVVFGHEAGRRLREATGALPVRSGRAAVVELATDPEVDVVVVGIPGTAALEPAHAALLAGKTVAMANKESLVAAGPIMQEAARQGGGRILPVDSEHNALFRLLEHTPAAAVDRVFLTASGGPFLTRDPQTLAQATPEEALCHPSWRMGPLVSVNSATLMNKGLEVIEAMALFGLALEKVDAVIHPSCQVHAIVRWRDGTATMHAAPPDMAYAIFHALTWPDTVASGLPPFDPTNSGGLLFQPLEPGRFPCYDLARSAAATGGAAPAVLNAANEVAVGAFLAGTLPFTWIPIVVERVLEAVSAPPPTTISEVLAVDNEARAVAARVAKG
ncbi:1-deoxy-D-xylulose-5-phosphate reductoisomerase [bacterium]|nr:1-deoxy-D-xylulose-5-phosphate reductoisomerase [bacterium]